MKAYLKCTANALLGVLFILIAIHFNHVVAAEGNVEEEITPLTAQEWEFFHDTLKTCKFRMTSAEVLGDNYLIVVNKLASLIEGYSDGRMGPSERMLFKAAIFYMHYTSHAYSSVAIHTSIPYRTEFSKLTSDLNISDDLILEAKNEFNRRLLSAVKIAHANDNGTVDYIIDEGLIQYAVTFKNFNTACLDYYGRLTARSTNPAPTKNQKSSGDPIPPTNNQKKPTDGEPLIKSDNFRNVILGLTGVGALSVIAYQTYKHRKRISNALWKDPSMEVAS